jgi:hypothetical protein
VPHLNVNAIIANPLARASATLYLFEKDSLRTQRASAWRLTARSHRSRNSPTHGLAPLLLGHLLSTGLVYLALLLLTWAMSQCFILLSSVGQLPDDAAVFLARLKLVVLYGEGSLFAYFWVTGAWHLFKEMRR